MKKTAFKLIASTLFYGTLVFFGLLLLLVGLAIFQMFKNKTPQPGVVTSSTELKINGIDFFSLDKPAFWVPYTMPLDLDPKGENNTALNDTIISTFEAKQKSKLLDFDYENPKVVETTILVTPKNRSQQKMILYWQSILAISGLFLWVMTFWYMLAFFNAIRKEQIFTYTNFRRLRIIGFFLIGLSVWEVLKGLAVYNLKLNFLKNNPDFVWRQMVASTNETLVQMDFKPNHVFTLELLNDYLLIGVIILLLAEIFRYGFQLQQEQDLTI
ncbi:MAG: DUF2975 domain-containing protein [Runella sp.]